MIATTQNSGVAEMIFAAMGMAVMIIPFVLPIICGVIGTINEKKHYQSIHARERATAHIPTIPTSVSDDSQQVVSAKLVMGATVVAPDSFRRFLAGIRQLVGGRLRSYESLLDRARREAVLRMKEQAPEAHAIVNFRIETSKIGGLQNKQSIIAIEILAYGTALTYGDKILNLNENSLATPPPLPPSPQT